MWQIYFLSFQGFYKIIFKVLSIKVILYSKALKYLHYKKVFLMKIQKQGFHTWKTPKLNTKKKSSKKILQQVSDSDWETKVPSRWTSGISHYPLHFDCCLRRLQPGVTYYICSIVGEKISERSDRPCVSSGLVESDLLNVTSFISRGGVNLSGMGWIWVLNIQCFFLNCLFCPSFAFFFA